MTEPTPPTGSSSSTNHPGNGYQISVEEAKRLLYHDFTPKPRQEGELHRAAVARHEPPPASKPVWLTFKQFSEHVENLWTIWQRWNDQPFKVEHMRAAREALRKAAHDAGVRDGN